MKPLHDLLRYSRGCQAPWNFRADWPIRMCTDIAEILTKFNESDRTNPMDYYQHDQTTWPLGIETGCHVPCASSTFAKVVIVIYNNLHLLNELRFF